MASILKVGDKWRALIRRKGHAAQCKTFGTKAAAEAWARKIEGAIDDGVVAVSLSELTVSQVIQAYRELREATRPIPDTGNEHYMLKALDGGLGDKLAARLTPDDLVDYAKARRDSGAGPYTINMDLSKLGTAMRYGGASLKVALPDAVGAARPTLTYLRLIGGGGKRERRPTEDEFTRIVDHFEKEHGERFRDAVIFSALSAMRRGEVTVLRWVDLDEATKVASVWRKHPKKGKVLERVPILPPAWAVLQMQPRDDERIFPFSGSTLSKYFTNTCRDLSIPDLHLHDLRHEGASSLFEQGYSIEQVALVTGHKSWNMLRRYTQLKPDEFHKLKPKPAL